VWDGWYFIEIAAVNISRLPKKFLFVDRKEGLKKLHKLER
jgi:hypothetical protein